MKSVSSDASIAAASMKLGLICLKLYIEKFLFFLNFFIIIIFFWSERLNNRLVLQMIYTNYM